MRWSMRMCAKVSWGLILAASIRPKTNTLGKSLHDNGRLGNIGIRPAQCVTPPPSLTAELLQLQPSAAQAAPPQQLLLSEIIIKICVQPTESLAAAKQGMLGFPRVELQMPHLPLCVASLHGSKGRQGNLGQMALSRLERYTALLKPATFAATSTGCN